MPDPLQPDRSSAGGGRPISARHEPAHPVSHRDDTSPRVPGGEPRGKGSSGRASGRAVPRRELSPNDRLILDNPRKLHWVLVEDISGATISLIMRGDTVPEFINFIRLRTSGSARYMGLAS